VRQKAYVASLRARAPYTPQAIVDGAAEVLGSDRARLLAAVAAAAARPAARLALEVAPADGEVTARVAIELPAELRGRRWELLLAVYETGLVTVVHRGENQGRELDNDYVVRTLRRAGRLRDRGEARIEREARLPLARDWQRSRLGVVAFLQDAETLAVGGVAARALGAP
jgi:hypothetical protein